MFANGRSFFGDHAELILECRPAVVTLAWTMKLHVIVNHHEATHIAVDAVNMESFDDLMMTSSMKAFWKPRSGRLM